MMNRLLRHGQLEVETDLLLGAEDVLLPAEWREPLVATQQYVAAPAGMGSALGSVVEPKSALRLPAPRPGFEPELFAVRPAATTSAATSAPSAAAAAEPAPASAERVAAVVQPSSAASSGVPVELQDSVIIPPGSTNAERLAALEVQHAAGCPHCTNATAHTRLVFGEGNPEAELVFVGEAPGETEDQLGRPFVGRAGEKLDEMIRAMGFRREDVYIANVLKSRPPDNRTPLAHEIAGCGPYLLAQLAIVAPRAIVTLGGPASKLLLRSELGITRLRGVLGSVEIRDADGESRRVPVMPTFHPAYVLRNYTAETRAQVWSDLKKVLEVLGRSAPARR